MQVTTTDTTTSSGHSNEMHCFADDNSKDPYKLGLKSIMQDCTASVPPLADIDIGTVSRVLYGDYSVAGKQLKDSQNCFLGNLLFVQLLGLTAFTLKAWLVPCRC